MPPLLFWPKRRQSPFRIFPWATGWTSGSVRAAWPGVSDWRADARTEPPTLPEGEDMTDRQSTTSPRPRCDRPGHPRVSHLKAVAASAGLALVATVVVAVQAGGAGTPSTPAEPAESYITAIGNANATKLPPTTLASLGRPPLTPSTRTPVPLPPGEGSAPTGAAGLAQHRRARTPRAGSSLGPAITITTEPATGGLFQNPRRSLLRLGNSGAVLPVV